MVLAQHQKDALHRYCYFHCICVMWAAWNTLKPTTCTNKALVSCGNIGHIGNSPFTYCKWTWEINTENKIMLIYIPLTKLKKEIGLSHVTLDFSGLAIPQNIFSHALLSWAQSGCLSKLLLWSLLHWCLCLQLICWLEEIWDWFQNIRREQWCLNVRKKQRNIWRVTRWGERQGGLYFAIQTLDFQTVNYGQGKRPALSSVSITTWKAIAILYALIYVFSKPVSIWYVLCVNIIWN